MHCENESAPFAHYKFTSSFMYCELLFATVVLLINIPLSLSLGYRAQMYSMRGPNRHVDFCFFKKKIKFYIYSML